MMAVEPSGIGFVTLLETPDSCTLPMNQEVETTANTYPQVDLESPNSQNSEEHPTHGILLQCLEHTNTTLSRFHRLSVLPLLNMNRDAFQILFCRVIFAVHFFSVITSHCRVKRLVYPRYHLEVEKAGAGFHGRGYRRCPGSQRQLAEGGLIP